MSGELKLGPFSSRRASHLLLMGAVCSVIVPCMAGLALSQKLHRWPVGERTSGSGEATRVYRSCRHATAPVHPNAVL